MYYEDKDNGTFHFVAGMLLGAVLGASIALLAAPAPGKRTRRNIVRAVSRATHDTGEKLESLRDEVGNLLAQRRGRRVRRSRS